MGGVKEGKGAEERLTQGREGESGQEDGSVKEREGGCGQRQTVAGGWEGSRKGRGLRKDLPKRLWQEDGRGQGREGG